MEPKQFHSYGNWELQKKLGAGGFGEVILWKNRITQIEIATKSLNKNEKLGTDEVNKLEERWTQELEFMRSLNVEYIVRAIELEDKAFEAYLNELHAWRPLPVLAMEYCNGGDLRAHLQRRENWNGLCEFEVREVLRSLRNAVDYMHNRCNIKHRDLKPENIVIHKMSNGKKLYKLTDFGFARYINDETMLLSVVGTRDYFAPEIVDSGGYTKTVDYWSVGVMAFEMLCGVLPFIPHQRLFHKINQIKQKPENCIAITEDLEKPEVFHFHYHIFNENRVSAVFRHEIEKWLRMSLEISHRKRGTASAGLTAVPHERGGRVLRFYADLDATLNMRVLSVFCLSTYRFYHYKVDETTTVEELLRNTVTDTGIALKQQYFILPVGHKLTSVSQMVKPLDFFVDDWCDASDSSNPPAMLYIADAENNVKFQEPQISTVIQRCFPVPTSSDAADEAPIWLTQKFALNINFLLTNEQRHLTAFLDGLQQYAINVEHSIFEYEMRLKELHSNACIIKGMAVQFVNSLEAMRKAQHTADSLANWQQKLESSKQEIDTLVGNIVPKLQTRYYSALRRIKEHASNKLYEELIKQDIYDIAGFQNHLQSSHLNYRHEELVSKTSVCNKCRRFVQDCLEQRAKFFENKPVVSARGQISAVVKEFNKLKEAVTETGEWLNQMYKKIEELTKNFYNELLQSQRHDSLQDHMMCSQMAPPATATDTTMVNSAMNGLCNSFDHITDISTKDLIQETQESLRLLSMDLDQPLDEIPTTVFSN